MTAAESREERALRELNEATAPAFGPGRRRGGNVRVTVCDTEHGRDIEAEQEPRGQVTRIPTGER